ncbi:hypothetical protein EVAR_101345_1 [Eumeta japonica]|uniref:Uncharacterized protein n=1 Tax=Eumeta variegata TaxID=151549 RepID=A0A4C1SV95_EUMVA|nr:hypothetical protein EVAR_101345_1 [Eumeta japonica]
MNARSIDTSRSRSSGLHSSRVSPGGSAHIGPSRCPVGRVTQHVSQCHKWFFAARFRRSVGGTAFVFCRPIRQTWSVRPRPLVRLCASWSPEPEYWRVDMALLAAA